MCGIAGVVGGNAGGRAQRMRCMRDRIVHRGPDSPGEYVDDRAALGIRRLRVIDLVTGDQPIANETSTVWTVFNGEIYNYRELRQGLAERGHVLRTQSDTEVIVHLYEELGPGFVERIEGMFALAVWDSANATLTLARDRMGKKPLLYAQRDGELVFASEHAALLAGLGARPGVDGSAIHAFLRLGYVPSPMDAFSGVRKLPPAHVLTWSAGSTTIRRYWSLPAPGTARIDEADAIVELRGLLRRAVERRLLADVPIGAFLSGGVDSSAVVATMASLRTHVRTFTIGFDDHDFSEVRYARLVADRFGTEHHEFVVRPDAVEVLPDLVRHYGEPFADSSAIPTFYLSKMTRQHVTVALNGDGGDEAFAGYERYYAARLASRLERIPAGIRRPLLGVAARVLPDSIDPRSRLRRAGRFLEAAAQDRRERYLRWVGVFDRPRLDRLLDPEFASTTDSVEQGLPVTGLDAADPAVGAQLHDLAHYLPDDLLVKVDIASMANSLEVRSPFLDRELVEFAVSLPMDLKLRGEQRKYLLKKAFEDVLPRESIHRRKQGFAVPVGAWLRKELRAMAEDTILSDRAVGRGYFRRDALTALVRGHTEGRADETHRVWALLMLELWHREFIDR